MAKLTAQELASCIDHTLLKADARKADVEKLCDEAVENGFATVVVNSTWVEYCHAVLAKTPEADEDRKLEQAFGAMLAPAAVPVCTVVSFPLGAESITVKSFAAEDAVRKGAAEIDMVLNIALVKEGLWDEVEDEVACVKEGMEKFAMGNPPLLKVIIEAPLLTDEEITEASKRLVAGGADFVKTNSGFVGEGAKPEQVALIREAIGDSAKIKASAGIRSLEQATALIEAGADRLGTSAAIQIMAEAKASE